MIRCLFALSLGVLVASILGDALTGDPLYGTLLVVAIVVASIALPLTIIGSVTSGMGLHDPKKVAAAKAAGRTTLARVTGIRATGSAVNDQPVCELELLVVSRQGHGPYRTTLRQVVNLARLPSLQPGAVVVVTQLDPERPEVALDDAPDPDWQRRAETDRQVRDLPTADVWVAPRRGRAPGAIRRIPFVVFPVLAVLGLAGALYPAWDEVGRLVETRSIDTVRAEHDAAAAAETSMFTPGNLRPALDAVLALSGDDVTEVYVYDQWVRVTAPTSPGATTTDEWQYRDGEATHEGASLIQPEPEDVPRQLFDASEIDWEDLPPLFDETERLTGIDDADDPMLWVARKVWADEKPSDPQVHVYVSDDYYDGSVDFAVDGTVVDAYGGAPGSEVAAAAEDDA
ncbi:hypothetical protein ACH436_09595 [Isoptericola sp. NPDC019693]|uniref:hypothetical protein n=1 Tax=Isoptericola sp. NPDC019693 TaxID=3364009 RepID=UPI00378EE6A2